MTLTFEFSREQEKLMFLDYMKEVYEYIDLDKDCIPAAVHQTENVLELYMTDEFFMYTYRFFVEQLVLGLEGLEADRKKLKSISKDFRYGAIEFLMNIV